MATTSSRPKVFCVGVHKTGTTSLKKALELLGYHTIGPTPEVLEPILEGRWGDVDAVVEAFDAFQDDPWFLAYEYLERRYPDARFILTIRDRDRWIGSVQRHFADRVNPTRRAVYGDVSALQDPEHYKDCYDRHNRAVVEYFSEMGRDLLVIDMATAGWDELCAHLGATAPRSILGRPIPLPHANAASTLEFRNRHPRINGVRVSLKDAFVRLFGPRGQQFLTAVKFRATLRR